MAPSERDRVFICNKCGCVFSESSIRNPDKCPVCMEFATANYRFMDAMEIESQFSELESRITEVERDIDLDLDALEDRVRRLEELEERVRHLEERLA